MSKGLKLSHKASILVGVPVGLMLVFLLSLFILFEKVELEASETDRSKTIIATANGLVKQWYDSASQLIIYKHNRTDEERNRFESKIKQTMDSLTEFRSLIKGDPAELRQLEKLKKISNTGKDLMERYLRHLANEEPMNELEVGILYKELDMTGAAFTTRLQELVDHETLKHHASSREEMRTRMLVKTWIVGGALTAIAIGGSLAFIFNRNTTRRLALLMDNTVRLSKKEPLLPKLSGDDEISQLDLFFHKMADDLAEATRKERAILDNAVDVICSIDKEGRFAAVNPASAQVWEINPEDLIGKHYSELIAKGDIEKFGNAITENREKSELLNLENRVLAGQGKEVHTLWSIRWAESEQSFFCVAHDITDRKEVERLKQEFVAVVSHELRTPLTSLEMTLDLLLNGNYGPITPVAEKRIKGAEVGISRLIMLINDLLDMEKMEAGKLSMKYSDVDLSELIERSIESVRGFAEQQCVLLCNDNSAGKLVVLADPDRIVQVLVNLLSNAVKFSEDDSSVSVETSSTKEYTELRVVDHGAGIPPGFEESIFEKYSQAHSSSSKRTRGTGLGLPICKAIIEQHGGTIGVTSTEGGGSTFWFRIPVSS